MIFDFYLIDSNVSIIAPRDITIAMVSARVAI